ncbi:MAG: hypothetical protein WA421_00665 [Nitrososphaeraceae archaeon]
MEDRLPDTLPAGVCCVLDGALGVALFPVVVVGCSVSGCVVTVGVAGLT